MINEFKEWKKIIQGAAVSSVEVKPKKLNNKQNSRTYRTLVVKPQRSLKFSSYCYRFQQNLISMVIFRLLIVSFYTSTNRWTATIVNKSSKYPQKKCVFMTLKLRGTRTISSEVCIWACIGFTESREESLSVQRAIRLICVSESSNLKSDPVIFST